MKGLLNIQVVIDPDWEGSISPYRLITNGLQGRPQTLSEIKRSLEYYVNDLDNRVADHIRWKRNNV